jgi:arsenite methyltransferase
MATRLDLDALLAEDGIEACCAALYENPAVRWLLGGELHPGGEEVTRRTLRLIELRPGERLLDVGSGTGSSALLAARVFGCRCAGLDYGAEAVRGARREAVATGLGDRIDFFTGEAGALPFADGEFDAVLCECSLSTFPDKGGAVGEMRRVLRTGGRVAITDVVVDPERIPAELRGPIATIACVGSALRREGYEELLEEAGFELLAVESQDADAARLAERIEDRLRGLRLLGPGLFDRSPFGVEEAIHLTRLARRAIADGSLGYVILAARAR